MALAKGICAVTAFAAGADAVCGLQLELVQLEQV